MYRHLIASVLAFFALSAGLHAEDTVEQKLRTVADSLFPGQKADFVQPSPLPGVYQIAYGARLFYLSEDGRHLFSGDLYDLEQDANLTEQWRGKARVAALAKEENSFIVYPAKGQNRHTLTVFTDVDCIYCRKLHAGIKEMNELGITVRYLAFPRAGIPSPSYDKLASVWCAKDQRKAMDIAKREEPVKANVCKDNPVAAHLKLGHTLGVDSTPTLMLEDGTLLPGYLPPQALLRELDRMKLAQAASGS